MTIKLYYSNSSEILAEKLIHDITLANTDLLNPPCVIAPNPHVMKWLKLQIAALSELCININFTVPDKGLFEAVRLIDSRDIDVHSIEEIDLIDLSLLICAALNQDSGITPNQFSHYLKGKEHSSPGDTGTRLWQLSSRLARYFSEYQLYRPDMLHAWQQNRTIFNTPMEKAQKKLFTEIFQKNGIRDSLRTHKLTLAEYWEQVKESSPLANRQAEIHIFGMSQLSPLHTLLLYELGKYLTIKIYQINPCSEFWEDITTPWEDRWLKFNNALIEQKSDGEYLADNQNENQLLKLWGKPGRETIKLLSLLEEQAGKDEYFYSEWLQLPVRNNSRSVLNILQSQVQHCDTSGDKIKQDSSLQIIACPDIFREVESTYNSIINNLEHNPEIKMTDIAIMTPDIEQYAPVIKSVFNKSPHRINYSIIDSNALTESSVSHALLTILQLALNDFNRKDMFELLYNPCIMKSFNTTRSETDTWLNWTKKLRIFDSHKQSKNTWQHGIRRLCFGRIMAPLRSHDTGLKTPFHSIIPYSDPYTTDPGLLQKFGFTVETLYNEIKKIPQECSGTEWLFVFNSIISECISVPESREEEQIILKNIKDSLSKLVSFDSLSLDFIREYLKDNLGAIPGSSGNYLVSGVNISALVPKRHIPFKIIYILGMGEGDFPGTADLSNLNLINTKRRIGDISRPDANKYLFLETLLLPRDKLYITYINKDLQKDQKKYPNSITIQLVDYLEKHVISGTFEIQELPMTGDSVRQLSGNRKISAYSDFCYSMNENSYYLNLVSRTDKYILVKRIEKTNPALYRKLAKKLSQQWPNLLPDNTDKNTEDNNDIVTINELATFLYNPANSTIKKHLRLREDESFFSQLADEEPLYSPYRFDYDFIKNIVTYNLKQNKRDTSNAIEDQYYNLQLQGKTPPGIFANIDREQLHTSIRKRLDNNPAWSEIILKNDNQWTFHHTVVFGEHNCDEAPDLEFSPCTLSIDNREFTLNGHIQHIWKNSKTGNCETLVISQSSSMRQSSLLQPFLFYIIARSGINKKLAEFIHEKLTIHILIKSELKSFIYDCKQQECLDYLKHLLADFNNETSFDLMPLEIISREKLLPEKIAKINNRSSAETLYRKILVNEIETELSKTKPAFRITPLLELIAPEIPGDAYKKAQRRLSLFLKRETV